MTYTEKPSSLSELKPSKADSLPIWSFLSFLYSATSYIRKADCLSKLKLGCFFSKNTVLEYLTKNTSIFEIETPETWEIVFLTCFVFHRDNKAFQSDYSYT